jgi:tRNA nucleotidyltransferase/poly(A) polymerase
MSERLKIISHERITDEFLKIMSAEIPSIGFYLMNKCGILDIIFPEIAEMQGVDEIDQYQHKDVFKHTLQVVDNIAQVSDKIPLRIAGLLHDVAKPKTKAFKYGIGWTFHGHEELGSKMVEGIFRRMRLNMDWVGYIEKLVKMHLRPISLVDENVTDSAVRRVLFEAGEDIDDLMILCRADITTKNPARLKEYQNNFDKVEKKMKEVEEKDKLRAFQPPIRGDEIMKVCGIEPGPLVGKIKKQIENAILDGIIQNEYNSAYQYLLKIKDTMFSVSDKDGSASPQETSGIKLSHKDTENTEK